MDTLRKIPRIADDYNLICAGPWAVAVNELLLAAAGDDDIPGVGGRHGRRHHGGLGLVHVAEPHRPHGLHVLAHHLAGDRP